MGVFEVASIRPSSPEELAAASVILEAVLAPRGANIMALAGKFWACGWCLPASGGSASRALQLRRDFDHEVARADHFTF